MATMWNPSSWLRMAAKNPPEDQLAQQQAEEQAALPFLLMGNQAAGPQMSFAQPFDQGMTAVAPQPVMPTVQPIVPESEPVAPPPPTQQDMSAAAVGQPPVEEDYMANMDPYARELLKNYQQSIAGQKEQLSLAEKRLLEAQQSKGQMNLAPLARLVDVWTGSNLASAYMPPQSKEKIVQQLQDAVLKARGDITQSAQDMYTKASDLQMKREALQNAREDRALRRAEAAAAAGLRGEKADVKTQIDIQQKYNKELGTPMKQLSTFVSKVRDLKNYLMTKPEIPYYDKKYKELVSKIVTQYNSDVANLGALAGADLELLIAAVGQEAGGAKGAIDTFFRNKFGGGSASAIESLNRLEQQAYDKVNMESESLKESAAWPFVEKLHNKNVELFNKSFGKSKATSQVKPLEQMSPEEKTQYLNTLKQQAGE